VAAVIAPLFVFDSHDVWKPVPVEGSLDAANVKGRPTMAFDHLDMPARMQPVDLPVVGYHRVVRGGSLYWHQFWLWYLYNDWSVAGVGRHEGDWEFVQIGCLDSQGNVPILVTGSEHHSGGKREYWACELGSLGRPVIYVAKGSHANYFSAGSQGGGQDHCDGKAPIPDIEWRDFGPWATWHGRWGNSTGPGRSPESPGCQGARWAAPHLYHSASS
jgi:hypothetical protein